MIDLRGLMERPRTDEERDELAFKVADLVRQGIITEVNLDWDAYGLGEVTIRISIVKGKFI